MDVIRSGPPIGESSSSSSPSKYDVFVTSFGGIAAKRFTNNLYTGLIQAGFNTFFKSEQEEEDVDVNVEDDDDDFYDCDDDDFYDSDDDGFYDCDCDDVEKGGITITAEIESAIEKSRVSIIVFSEHYASASDSSSSSSKWWSVVEELAKVLECRRILGNLVLPVYYGVDASQAQESIGEALKKYEEEFKLEMDDQVRIAHEKTWRKAIRETEYWSELDPRVLLNPAADDDSSESSFIREVIEEIHNKLHLADHVPSSYLEEVHSRQKEIKQGESWYGKEIHMVDGTLSELPENPYCPFLVELFLQRNSDLAEIPLLFFKKMPALQLLDLSNTSIKSLPPSISSLVTLRELFMRDCQLLMELPPEIGALTNLKVLDLEGTKLIYLPKEIRRLLKLVSLKVSLYRCSDKYRESREIEAVFPRATLSNFYHLKELSIDVDPDCRWWDVEVEAIIEELSSLRNLQTLKLYLPKVELLQRFLQVTRGRAVEGSLFLPFTYSTLSNFRLIVGRHEQRVISCLPVYLQVEFERLEKCLKYVNGEGTTTDVIGQAVKHASALFLERHWSIEKLSVFKIDEMDKLKFCLLVECNEMSTIVDGADLYKQGEERINNVNKKTPLGSLQYLGIHYMKNLERIWKGPMVSGCFSSLQVLDLHTCPNLSTIFSLSLLSNLTNLKELTLEDCPNVKSVVSVDPCSYEYFLPSLEKISLLDLPELIAIFSDAHIAPILERMLVYNCPNLKTLYPMETSSMKEIKGESEWWEGLEWHQPEQGKEQYDHLLGIFVPLKSDCDLVEELAEAQHQRLNTFLCMFQASTDDSQVESLSDFVIRDETELNKILDQAELSKIGDETHAVKVTTKTDLINKVKGKSSNEAGCELDEKNSKGKQKRSPFAHFEESDHEVDAKADDFINKFKHQLKLQRLDSVLRYKEVINRRSVGK